MRLQIFLLQKDFSAGKIDGKSGKFTTQILKLYKEAHPLESSQNIENSLKQINPYINYRISDEDKKFVGNVPQTLAKQAHKKYLPYGSFAGFVADRFHTDIAFLKAINPHINLKKLKPGDELIVPNAPPFLIEKVTDKQVRKQSKFAKRRIQVDIKRGILILSEGKAVLAVFPVTTGSGHVPTPKGLWKIKKITYLPTFRYDKKLLNEGKPGKKYYDLPPGPNSPVGIVWMGLNKPGVGIHGTNAPATIGRSVSHGCIRLSNGDAVQLSRMITSNIPVHIY